MLHEQYTGFRPMLNIRCFNTLYLSVSLFLIIRFVELCFFGCCHPYFSERESLHHKVQGVQSLTQNNKTAIDNQMD